MDIKETEYHVADIVSMFDEEDAVTETEVKGISFIADNNKGENIHPFSAYV